MRIIGKINLQTTNKQEVAMPLRRLTDYTGITIWVATLIFTLGILYSQINDNSKSVKELKDYGSMVHLIEKEIASLKMQDKYQERWKSEFMTTFKELVTEMKKNNHAILQKMQSTDNNLLKTSYQLDAITTKLKIEDD